MPERDPRPWKKGDKFSASHMNEGVDNVRPLTRPDMSHGNGSAHFTRTPQGTSFHIPHTWEYLDTRFGLITSAGPTGQPDFPDERYWVKEAFPNNTTSATNQVVFKPRIPVPGSEPFPVCVTNLSEIIGHTHALATDETQAVEITAFMDRTNQVVRWYMNVGGSGGSSMLYGRFVAFVGPNLVTVHPCNPDASTIDLTTTLYLMMSFPVGTSNKPPFANFQANVDVLGYFALPTGFAITISGHPINGVLESFTQWPYTGSVGQGPYTSIAAAGSTPATHIWDWPTLHPIP